MIMMVRNIQVPIVVKEKTAIFLYENILILEDSSFNPSFALILREIMHNTHICIQQTRQTPLLWLSDNFNKFPTLKKVLRWA